MFFAYLVRFQLLSFVIALSAPISSASLPGPRKGDSLSSDLDQAPIDRNGATITIGLVLIIFGAAFMCAASHRAVLFRLCVGFYMGAISAFVIVILATDIDIPVPAQIGCVILVIISGLVIGNVVRLWLAQASLFLVGTLGGLTLSVWAMMLSPNGSIESPPAKIMLTFITMTAGCLLCRIPFAADLVRAVSSALTGATSVVVGLDCFLCYGLKEYWIYITGVHNSSYFPSGKYHLNKNLKIELYLIISMTILAVLIQNLVGWVRRREICRRIGLDRSQKSYNLGQGKCSLPAPIRAKFRVPKWLKDPIRLSTPHHNTFRVLRVVDADGNLPQTKLPQAILAKEVNNPQLKHLSLSARSFPLFHKQPLQPIISPESQLNRTQLWVSEIAGYPTPSFSHLKRVVLDITDSGNEHISVEVGDTAHSGIHAGASLLENCPNSIFATSLQMGNGPYQSARQTSSIHSFASSSDFSTVMPSSSSICSVSPLRFKHTSPFLPALELDHDFALLSHNFAQSSPSSDVCTKSICSMPENRRPAYQSRNSAPIFTLWRANLDCSDPTRFLTREGGIVDGSKHIDSLQHNPITPGHKRDISASEADTESAEVVSTVSTGASTLFQGLCRPSYLEPLLLPVIEPVSSISPFRTPLPSTRSEQLRDLENSYNFICQEQANQKALQQSTNAPTVFENPDALEQLCTPSGREGVKSSPLDLIRGRKSELDNARNLFSKGCLTAVGHNTLNKRGGQLFTSSHGLKIELTPERLNIDTGKGKGNSEDMTARILRIHRQGLERMADGRKR